MAVQLCYYRGPSEFHASPWISHAPLLLERLEAVTCAGGATQIERLLHHYLRTGTSTAPVRALIFVGDAVEETSARLTDLAGQCGIKKQPIFVFQEGNDTLAAQTFEQMARLSGGAYARLNGDSGTLLQELLGAVVRYATGGRLALTSSNNDSDKLLLRQLPGKRQ